MDYSNLAEKYLRLNQTVLSQIENSKVPKEKQYFKRQKHQSMIRSTSLGNFLKRCTKNNEIWR
jgi:hypothetical protein